LGVDGKAEVEKHFQEWSVELQIPPLRFAPVGMTKGRVTLPWEIGLWVIRESDRGLRPSFSSQVRFGEPGAPVEHL